jgi:L-arabinose isomerase
MRLRPRIAVVAAYMPFFDEIMPPDYARDREMFGSRVAAAVEPVGDVTYLGFVHDHGSGDAAGRKLSELEADAVLVVPTMAAPAGYLWRVLAPNPAVPVVLFAAHEIETVPPDYDMIALCRHSANVGALMIGNILSREGRPFLTVVGPRDRDDIRSELHQALKVAALAGGIRRTRIGRLGEPIDGYDNVKVNAAALRQAIGAELVDIPLPEWEDACRTVTGEQAAALVGSLGAAVTVDDRGRPGEVIAASRMAAALQTVISRHGLHAGALNCRGAFGVGNSRIASLGCLAISHATSSGVPFTCTGDLITAVAMLIGKRLGGGALYCELDAIDEERDAFLCANTGEADLAWCTAGQPCEIFSSGADSGRFAPGCSVRQTLNPGPATMIGFSPRAGAVGGFTLIVMEGEVLEPPNVALSVTSAWFRADQRPMRKAMEGWIQSGATHHGSLSPGRLAEPITKLAALLGIGVECI